MLKQFKYKVWYPIRRKVTGAIYRFNCRVLPWRRYNIVKCCSLPPTWNDRDSVLLHAAFQIFTDFIDKEKPFEWFAFDHEDEIKEVLDQEAIDFWTTRDRERKELKKEMEYLYSWWQKRKLEEYSSLENNQYEIDNEHLIRLIKIRDRLWT